MVADRLIELWPSIKKIVRYWNKLPKPKQPKSKSYENVLQVVDDPFTTTKLTFFSYLAGILEPYLKKHRSDKPMVPYMYVDLKVLVKNLLQITVKDLKKVRNVKLVLD